MKPRVIWLGLACAIACLPANSRQGAPDLILFNGKIFTSITAAPYVEALAIRGTSAYAEFAEKDKGTLEPGKLADLAVLSQDIFSVPLPELPKTQSLLTLVGGRIVHDAGAL